MKKMNILFISLMDIRTIENHGIYEDLLREFQKRNHNIYIVTPTERRNNEETHIIDKKSCKILKVKTGNIQKSNLIEKGISTILLDRRFIAAIKRYYKDIQFDLILYSTPPVTFAKVVKYVKVRDNAHSYLLLKDILPDAAVDIGVLKKFGIKGMVYYYFRKKEQQLYSLSDYIGCMSQANVDYLLEHNPQLDREKVEICPNCVEPQDMSVGKEEKDRMRQKYDLPIDKKIFVYGGNLGKPQGIDFLLKCLKSQKENEKVFFLIVGSGTEYAKIKAYIDKEKPQNVRLMKKLPKEDYDRMVGSCDVGMIFLDSRFKVPNFPSRLLSYMQAKLPVLAMTDSSTDIGQVIEQGKFGWWGKSDNVSNFERIMQNIVLEQKMKENSFDYLREHYSAETGYHIIARKFSKE